MIHWRTDIWNISCRVRFYLPRVAKHEKIVHLFYFINTNTNNVNRDSIFAVLKDDKQAKNVML